MTVEKLQEVGVQTLAVVATKAERARLYFRFRPARCLVGADPDLRTHRAYGVPQAEWTPEIHQAAQANYGHLASELQLPVPEAEAWHAVDRVDGFEPTETDGAEMQRHQVQFVGQFLVDRDGLVRWVNIECAQGGLSGLDKFPSDEELLAAARAL
ncbi:MAG: hypothetical protein ACE5I3_11900 [Phycisphaerae bacterium]